MTSKQDYLKKYLSGGGGGKDKKKRKKVEKKKTVIVLDDDANWKKSVQSSDDSESDTPIIVEYRDEQKEMEMKAKWRPLVKQEVKEEPPPSSPQDYKPDIDSHHGNKKSHRHDSDSDLSPDRNQHKSHDIDHQTRPQGRGHRHDSDSDLSPERTGHKSHRTREDTKDRQQDRGHRHDSDSDLSPERGGHRVKTEDGRRQEEHNSDSDLSPERPAHQINDSDPSPPRRHPTDGGRRRSSPVRRRHDQDRVNRPTEVITSNHHKRSTMSTGGRAGLQTSKILRAENDEMRQRRERELKDMDPSLLGKEADTVYRDKHGRRIDPKLEKLKKKEEEKKKAEQDEQFYEWGRGVAQTRMAHDKVTDDLHEMSKPLARYKDDEDLENMLKARDREDDPMLEYMKKKKAKKNVVIDSHGTRKPKKERPTYKGSYPPNRFGIKPGYRWDGIDRSNGFEQSRFAREANKVAMAEVAYKWSVEDM